jgi:hypothetical protein
MRNTDAFNLNEKQAKEILEEVSAAVSGWRTVAKALGISARTIEKMEGAFC